MRHLLEDTGLPQELQHLPRACRVAKLRNWMLNDR